MPHWLDWSAFSVFLVVGAVGLAFLVLTLLVGELGEIFEGFEADHGGMDAGHDGPSVLSTRVLAMFVTGFGAAGALGTHYGMGVMSASGAGVATGLVLGGVVYSFARFLHGQQVSSTVKVADLVGHVARVIIAIPQGGVGQVRCHIGEELIDKIARTRDGGALPEHATVCIEEVVGEVVIVTAK